MVKRNATPEIQVTGLTIGYGTLHGDILGWLEEKIK